MPTGTLQRDITVNSQTIETMLEEVNNRPDYQVWSNLKKLEQTDPRANFIIDMVRSGSVPLHRFYPETFNDQLTHSDQYGSNGGGGGRQNSNRS